MIKFNELFEKSLNEEYSSKKLKIKERQLKFLNQTFIITAEANFYLPLTPKEGNDIGWIYINYKNSGFLTREKILMTSNLLKFAPKYEHISSKEEEKKYEKKVLEFFETYVSKYAQELIDSIKII